MPSFCTTSTSRKSSVAAFARNPCEYTGLGSASLSWNNWVLCRALLFWGFGSHSMRMQLVGLTRRCRKGVRHRDTCAAHLFAGGLQKLPVKPG